MEVGMSQARKADVLVVAQDCSPVTLRCLDSVLRTGGPALNRLIIVASSNLTRTRSRNIETIAREHSSVLVLRASAGLGAVEAYNRGLEERTGDVVLLRSDIEVTPGWLVELADAVYSEARTACASPLINDEGYCSIPVQESDGHFETPDEAMVRAACAGLPRWTIVPVLSGVCCYLRGDVIDAVGQLDASYPSVDLAGSDWVMRAQALGFFAKRANHAFVQRLTLDRAIPGNEDTVEVHESLLAKRHPHLQPQLDRFDGTLDRSLAFHAVRLHKTGRLRVAYDLRPLPREQVGTRIYAVSLAKALAEIPEIDLTLLVRDPVQARGLEGRVVTQETWEDDVEVIHRPSQVIDPRDLRLLYESSAHLIVTYQDLIGYRIPQVFPNDAEFHSYRATSCLSLQGVQRILAYSRSLPTRSSKSSAFLKMRSSSCRWESMPAGSPAASPAIPRSCENSVSPGATSSAWRPTSHTRTCPACSRPMHGCEHAGTRGLFRGWSWPVTQRVPVELFTSRWIRKSRRTA